MWVINGGFISLLLCKLETQESRWYTWKVWKPENQWYECPAQIWSLENQENHGQKIDVQTQVIRQTQKRPKVEHATLYLWFYSGLPAWETQSALFSLPIQMLNSETISSYKYILQQCFTVPGIQWSTQVDTSINCHIGENIIKQVRSDENIKI